ncbi:MAG: dihydroorotate dehydrogenase electron transfer subunit [Candidatus Hydrothermarchaeales archaeon]
MDEKVEKRERAAMRTVKIREVIEETNKIKTFILNAEISAMPGRFIMCWIPGLDEKPMSLSYTEGYIGVTVLEVGPFTGKMMTMKEGELLGFRGPLGRGFKVTGDKILTIGGGVGVAPLAPLADKALKEGRDVTAIIGALSASGILFAERMEKAGARVLITTDDGSAGMKGFTTDALKKLLEEESFDQCFTCGPEIMMYKVLQQTKGRIPTQACVERYFKCGIGVCGQCILDKNGLRVCKEGPVFRDKELETGEFGRYHRNASGLKESFGWVK